MIIPIIIYNKFEDQKSDYPPPVTRSPAGDQPLEAADVVDQWGKQHTKSQV